MNPTCNITVNYTSIINLVCELFYHFSSRNDEENCEMDVQIDAAETLNNVELDVISICLTAVRKYNRDLSSLDHPVMCVY